MRGLAIIDRLPGSYELSIWLTSRSPRAQTEVVNVNATTIDLKRDPDAKEIVRSMTRCRAVLVTDATELKGLPIEGDPVRVSDLVDLLAEVVAWQVQIVAAVRDYSDRVSTTLVEPVFSPPPLFANFVPDEDTSTRRAFVLAECLRTIWKSWLRTEAERIKRTIQPRTGRTPWIMPADMNGQEMPDFPPGFAARLNEQPLV